jgi:glutamine amidotransferase
MHAETNQRIVVIDYGMGNLRSVLNKVEAVCANTVVSSDPQEVSEADKLILPGVGHFAQGMKNLEASGIMPHLYNKVTVENTPILGICLGMQLFSKFSEEGDIPGLGWIDGRTCKFSDDMQMKIPHMGWNTLELRKESVITKNIPQDEQYYFCHSYHFECANEEDILASTTYGIQFTSAVQRDNIYGVQFHPEKSHDWGAQIMTDFLLAA